MKFKRYMTAICSSALVLGLSFLLYPQSPAATDTKVAPTTTAAPTASPVTNVPTGEEVPESTPAPTATTAPTPTPEIEHHKLLTGDLTATLSGVADVVTSYITSYYANDYDAVSALVTDASLLNTTLMETNAKNVSKVEDITLYSKPGIDGIFSIVYASYSLYYKDLQLSVPQFSEYYVKRLADGTFRIQTVPLSSKTMAAFAEARRSENVLELAISSLIRRYHTACLTVNETLLKQCVTDSDYLDLDYLASRYSVTESFSDYEFLLYPGINEFDYIVFVTHKEKIVFSDTPAPCMESYYISLNPSTGVPSIYLGITSLDTDAYCAAVIQSDEIQALAKETNTDMQEALLADDDLKDFYQLLLSNGSSDN